MRTKRLTAAGSARDAREGTRKGRITGCVHVNDGGAKADVDEQGTSPRANGHMGEKETRLVSSAPWTRAARGGSSSPGPKTAGDKVPTFSVHELPLNAPRKKEKKNSFF